MSLEKKLAVLFTHLSPPEAERMRHEVLALAEHLESLRKTAAAREEAERLQKGKIESRKS